MKRLTKHGHWRFVIVVVLAVAYLITIQFIHPPEHKARQEPTPPPAPVTKMTEEQALKITRLALSSVFLEGYYSSLIQSGKDTKEWSAWGDKAANALLTGDRQQFDKMMRQLTEEVEKEQEERKGSRL